MVQIQIKHKIPKNQLKKNVSNKFLPNPSSVLQNQWKWKNQTKKTTCNNKCPMPTRINLNLKNNQRERTLERKGTMEVEKPSF